MNKSLESEERIELPFAGLQPAAKTTIDNSPIKFTVWWSRTTLMGFGVPGPRHEDQDRIEMALPAGLEPANIFVRSEAVFRLAYGSIEILKSPLVHESTSRFGDEMAEGT